MAVLKGGFGRLRFDGCDQLFICNDVVCSNGFDHNLFDGPFGFRRGGLPRGRRQDTGGAKGRRDQGGGEMKNRCTCFVLEVSERTVKIAFWKAVAVGLKRLE